MDHTQYLLVCLAEECAEVSHRAMKALRFGLDEIQPGQTLTNRERLVEELHDLISVAAILNTMASLNSGAAVRRDRIFSSLRGSATAVLH